MFNIITFGSATRDILLEPEELSVLENKEFSSGRAVCFPLGAKVEVKDINFSSGGGGTNTAVTFAKQGFSVAYCGKIGEDYSAKVVLDDLNYYDVDISMITTTPERATNHSVIINAKDEDRTILAYRGASDLHSEKDVDINNIKSDWVYFAPMSSVSLFYKVLKYALKEEIGVALNPGMSQINNEHFIENIKGVDVLLLNREEAFTLTKESDEIDSVKKVQSMTGGVVVVTKGREGLTAFDGKYFYKSKPIFPFAVDRTGAGDSFGSGFLSSYIRTESVKEGIVMGIANSTSCLQKIGAKRGLLNKGDNFDNVYVEKFN